MALGFRIGCTLQIRRWTIQRTLTRERAVRARAKPTEDQRDEAVGQRLLVLVTALASSPSIPADRAAPGVLTGRGRCQAEAGAP